MLGTNGSEALPGDVSDEVVRRSGPRHVPLPESPFRVWPWACLRAAGFPAEGVLALGAPEVAALIDQVLDVEGDTPLSCFDPDRREALVAAYQVANARIGGHARERARDPRFREAIMWQNRRAIHTGLDVLARKPIGGGNKKVRQKERLVAAYLQRYCVKNDTIGFFGPVCWVRVTEGPEPLAVQLGEGLIARRRVYFEQWCVDAISHRLAEDAELRAWAPPRLQPYVRLDSHEIRIPTVGAVPMSSAQIAVLAACDGATPACEIAAGIAVRAELGMSEEEALAFMEQGRSMRILGWDFAVPMQLHPERDLRALLERIGEPALRARAVELLDSVEAARDRVALAAGDDMALDRALEEFEATFHRITGRSPTRAEGRVYAARTLLYEDTHRAADVEIGAPLLAKLGPPFSLLLASVRWFTNQIAARFQRSLETLYDSLAPVDGAPVELALFQKAFIESEPSIKGSWARLSPRFREAQAELQARWATILPLPAGARRVRFASSDLRPRVLEAFAAERPGWEEACYASPDVMIVAENLEGIRRGDFQLVLGEVHLANTLSSSLFVSQHPDPGELRRLVDMDVATGQIVPILPHQDWSQRINPVLNTSRDFHYAFSSDPLPAPPARTLRVADLVLARHAGALEVRHRDGSFRRSILEHMGYLLALMSANAFRVFSERAHTPRVTIDDLVIARESWRFDANELAFATVKDPLARWVDLKRWQRSHGIPRFVFMKAPVERKPCFIDLDAPLSIEVLSKLIRQTAENGEHLAIGLSEMLPAFKHAFFPDADGHRYTSELRLVMVDGAPLSPASQ